MLKAAKKYGSAVFVLIIFAALILLTVKEKVIDIYAGVTVSDSSFRTDILNSFDLEIKEIHGVRVDNHDADTVSYYFEYEAEDYNEVLNAISALPARIDDNRYSIRCGLLNSPTNPLDASKKLAKDELNASDFFWEATPGDYTFYECLKGSMRHTLLVSKTSSRVLHRIELV